jgi:hypothetical protein
MADLDDRVGTVPLEYLASVESQEPPENGEDGSFEMDGRATGEENIAPDIGSNVTPNSRYHVFEPTLPVHANNLIELSRHPWKKGSLRQRKKHPAKYKIPSKRTLNSKGIVETTIASNKLCSSIRNCRGGAPARV